MRTTDAADPRFLDLGPAHYVGHLEECDEGQNPLAAGTTNGCVREGTVSWRQSECSAAARPHELSRARVPRGMLGRRSTAKDPVSRAVGRNSRSPRGTRPFGADSVEHH